MNELIVWEDGMIMARDFTVLILDVKRNIRLIVDFHFIFVLIIMYGLTLLFFMIFPFTFRTRDILCVIMKDAVNPLVDVRS